MKIIRGFIVMFFLLSSSFLFPIHKSCAYDTPGTGVSWNMSDLVSHSNGAVTGAGGTFDVTESIIVTSGDTLQFMAGDLIRFTSGIGLEIAGILTVSGASDNTVTLTSSAASPSAGDWSGIVFVHGSTGTIDHAIIEYAQKGVYVQNTSSPIVTHCIIQNNVRGVEAYRAQDYFQTHPVVNYCDFLNNTESNYYTQRGDVWADGSLDAQWNFWGTVESAVIATMIHDFSDDVNLPMVDFAPFWQSDHTQAEPPGGGTYVQGTLIQDTIWTAAGGPYVITGGTAGDDGIKVGPGITLTIEPGTIIKSDPGSGIRVEGTLQVSGTSDATVTFTSSAASPSAGDWSGIVFVHGSTGTIDHAIIEYAQKGVYVQNTSSPIVTHCIIQNNVRGVEAYRAQDYFHTHPVVNYCDFLNNTESNYYTQRGDVWADGSLDAQWNFWGTVESAVIATMIHDFSDDVNLPMVDFAPFWQSDHTQAEPPGGGTYVQGTLIQDTIWTAAGGPYVITGGTAGDDGIKVGPGITLTIEPGTIIKSDPGSGIRVEGTLQVSGTSDATVTFTSSAASPSAGDWSGIVFVHGSTGTIDHAIIEYAQKGVYVQNTSSPIVTHCIIQNNVRGVEAYRAQDYFQTHPVVNYCDFLNNTESNYYTQRGDVWADGSLDAQWNFWGTVESAVIATMIHDFSDDVNLPMVDFAPFWQSDHTQAEPPGGGTYVQGTLIQDTIWTAAGGPYVITGGTAGDDGIKVGPGITLTIEPGTIIKSDPGSGIRVEGTLQVSGTSDATVTFTSSAASPSAGDWSGIVFVHGSTGTIDHAIIEYAQKGVYVQNTSSPIVTHCIIQNNVRGVEAYRAQDYFQTHPVVNYCDFLNNTESNYYTQRGDVWADGSLDAQWNFWGTVESAVIATMIHDFSDDVNLPMVDFAPFWQSDHTQAEPPGGGTYVQGTLIQDTIWTAAGGPYVITGGTAGDDGIKVGPGITLTIEPGTIIKSDPGSGIRVEGTLQVSGTSDATVTFTSSAASPSAGDWSGIVFVHGSTGTIDHAIIEYAQKGVYVQNTSSPIVTHCIIQNNVRGVEAYRAQDYFQTHPVVNYCDFLNNTESNYYTQRGDVWADGSLDAQWNFWGTVESAVIATMIHDFSDDVNLPMVDFAPFWQSDHTQAEPPGGGTYVQGTLIQDTIWTAAGGPYVITGGTAGDDGIKVGPGITLTIEPGTIIKSDPGSGIRVEGTLQVSGTSDATVTFTSSAASPSAGDWSGIVFVHGSTGTIDHAIIEYAQKGVYVQNTSSPIVTHCIIQNNVRGVEAYRAQDYFQTHPVVNYCDFLNNTESNYYTQRGDVWADGSLDAQWNFWGTVESAVIATMIHDFSDDVNLPMVDFAPFWQSDHTQAEPPGGGTYVQGTLIQDTIWTAAGGPYVITGGTAGDDGIKVGPGITLTIEPGTIIKSDPGSGIRVEGTLQVSGTSDATVTFTSSAASPSAGDWSGIVFVHGSTGTIDHAIIEYAQKGVYVQNTSSPIVTHCIIQNNVRGVEAYRAQDYFQTHPVVNYCDFLNNTESNYYTQRGDVWADGSLDAQWNFWGTVESAVIATMIHDFSDDVNLPMVDFAPFWQSDHTQAEPPGGGTYVQGTLIQDTIWTAAGGPYVITGGTAGDDGIKVGPGITLTIEPGTIIKSDPGSGIRVEGTLQVSGTSDATVTFTSSAASPSAGDWSGIVFVHGSTGTIDHAIIEYAQKGVYVQNTSSPIVTHCIIQNNVRGVEAYRAQDYFQTHPVVNYCDFLNNTESNYYTQRGDVWADGSLDAQWNFWGTVESAVIATMIHDFSDDGNLPMVDMTPYLSMSMGEILLDETFGDGQAQEFSELAGDWSIVNERYQTALNLVDAISTYPAPEWDSYSIDMDIIPQSAGSFGMLFRIQDASHYYRFVISSTGRQLEKIDGVATTLYEDSDGDITIGETSHITITVLGERLRGYIDHKEVFDIQNTTFSSGGIGLYASAETDVAFDNILVLSVNHIINNPPISDAGPDQTVASSTVVMLDGSKSHDPDKDPLDYMWEADTGNPVPVVLSDNNSNTAVQPTFTPATPGDYGFLLRVSDGTLISDPDEVVITVEEDILGPNIGDILFEGVVLSDLNILTQSGNLSVIVMDTLSYVEQVKFLLDDTLICTDETGSDGFTCFWDAVSIEDGDHVLTVTAIDSLGNMSQMSIDIHCRLAVPEPPVITAPADGDHVSLSTMMISGKADCCSNIFFLVNDRIAAGPVYVDQFTNFTAQVELVEGENRLNVTAQNRAGSSAKSQTIRINFDTGPPNPPTGLSLKAKPNGLIALAWEPPQGEIPSTYKVYRGLEPFSDPGLATCITLIPVSALSLDDVPGMDDMYYYGVTALDKAENESNLSIVVSAGSDREGPVLEEITYVPEGGYIPDTHCMGLGKVSLSIIFSEPLAELPYLAIRLSDGSFLPAHLKGVGPGQYEGYIIISETIGSGQGIWQYRGRDWVGNYSTTILADPLVLIDTIGPQALRIDLNHDIPLKNNPDAPLEIAVTLYLTEAIKEGTLPVLTYTNLDGEGPWDIHCIQDAENPLIWNGSLTLQANAGVSAGDYIEFAFQARDAVDNIGVTFQGVNRFDVYQGDLPPLPGPTGLIGEALAGGGIRLNWNPVEGAAGYQLYRQAPGDGNLIPHGDILPLVDFEETPGIDGSYQYAVASVRTSGEQIAISAPGNSITLIVDSLAPNAPRDPMVSLTGSGARVSWQMPLGEVPATYRLYRNYDSIEGIALLEPIIFDINGLETLDNSPSMEERYYTVTAIDASKNESMPSPWAYLEAEQLPVANLLVYYEEGSTPKLTWENPGGDVAGFNVYVDRDGELYQINPSLLTSPVFLDVGYNRQVTEYQVTTMDSSQAESSPHACTLPHISVLIPDETILYRGLINTVSCIIKNLDTKNPLILDEITMTMGGQNRHNGGFEVSPEESIQIDFLFSGSAEWNDEENCLVTLQRAQDEGTSVTLVYPETVAVKDGGLHIDILNEELVRGGNGLFKFVLHNTGAENIEIVTATGQGLKPSTDIRFHLLNTNGDILASAPLQQATGADVITRADGITIAAMAPGETFTSGPVELVIPLSAPDDVKIRAEIDRVQHLPGQPLVNTQSIQQSLKNALADEAIEGPGVVAVESRALVDTSYKAQITTVIPALSVNNGQTPIKISGQALTHDTEELLPLVPVRIAVTSGGTLRTLNVYTGDEGRFSVDYQPHPIESGDVYVCASHPNVEDRCQQASFFLSNLTLKPAQGDLKIPRNETRTIDIDFTYIGDQTLHNLSFAYDPLYQPGGSVLSGVVIQPANSHAILEPGGKGTLSFTITTDTTTPEAGTIFITAKSDETPDSFLNLFSLSFSLFVGEASLQATPGEIMTGVHPGDTLVETLTIENVGSETAKNISLELKPSDEGPNLNWIVLNVSPGMGDMMANETRDISISFQPDVGVLQQTYSYTLEVRGEDGLGIDIPIHATVTSVETGSARVYVYDPYVWKDDGLGGRIEGLEGARVTVQHSTAYTLMYEGTTNDLGNCDFTELPTGRYNYTVSASGHQRSSGTFLVKPGVQVRKEIYLDIEGVSFEWSVVPITIEDRYEIKLEATYKTHVPAPVVTIEPPSFVFPELVQGEIFYGEFTAENHGLIKAKKFVFWAVTGNLDYSIEILRDIPSELQAGEKIIIPYRIIRISEDLEEDPVEKTLSSARTLSAITTHASSDTGGSGSACATFCFNPCPWDPKYEKCGTICAPIHDKSSNNTDAGPGLSPGGTGNVGGINTSSKSTNLGGGDKLCLEDILCPPDPACADTDPSASKIDLINRQYTTREIDMGFVFRKLPVQVMRTYRQNKWVFNYFDERLTYEFDVDDLARGVENLSAITIDNLVFEQAGKLPADDMFNQSSQAQLTCDGSHNPCYFGQNYFFTARGFTLRTLGGYYRVTDTTQQDYFWTGFRMESRQGIWKEFDVYGRLAAYGDLNGNKITLVWENDENGRLTGVIDPTGRQVLWYEYNLNGQVSEVRDHADRSVAYTYTGENLALVTDVMDGTWAYEYDAGNRLRLKTDPENRSFTIEYDANGYLFSVRGPDGTGKEYTYHYDETSQERISIVKSPMGALREVIFDSKGRLRQKSFNQRNIQEYLYGDNLLHIRFEDGSQKQIRFDEWGNIIQMTNPDGTRISAEYNLLTGALKRRVNERGVVTEHGFDEAGNRVEQIEAVGTDVERQSRFVYDDSGNLITQERPGNAKVHFEYDAYGNITKRIDPLEGMETFSYDELNRLQTWTNKRSYQTHYAYDDGGHLIKITDPLGYTVEREYDAVGNLVKITNENNKSTTLEYDSYDRILKIIDALGYAVNFEYDLDGNLVKWTDQKDHSKEMAYDLEGNLISVMDAESNMVSFNYIFSDAPYCASCPVHQNKKRPREVIYPTSSERFEYNQKGQVTKKTQVLDDETSYQWQYHYDAAGNLILEIDPENHQRSYEYDALNRLLAETDPAEFKTEYTYDSRDNLLSEKDPDGIVTQYTYDLNDRMVSEKFAERNPTGYVYDAAGNTIEIVDPSGYSTTFEYNERNELVATLDDFGNTTAFEYDPTGKLIKEVLQDGQTFEYLYNDLGQEVKTIVPSGAAIEHTYDAAGNVSSYTDKAGRQWHYLYDALNRRIQSTNPHDEETTWTFEGPWLKKTVDVNGKINFFTRDALGRVITEIRKMNDTHPEPDEDDLITEYHYDPYGRWTQKKDPLGRLTLRAFDELGRHVRTTIPDGRVKVYTYSPAGKMASIQEINGNLISFEYNENGDLVKTADTLGIAEQNAYNKNGEMVSITNAGGETIQYTYDGIGRKKTITDPDLNSTEFVYDPMGRVLINSDRNQNELEADYNISGQLSSLKQATGAVTQYQYNTHDTISAVVDANTHTTAYEEDELGRIRRIRYNDNSVEEIAYDSLGHVRSRKLRDESLIQYVYDDAYRLVTIDYPGLEEDRSFAYDKAGRMMTASTPDHLIHMTYDTLNRPINVIQNGKTVTYHFDDTENALTIQYPGGDEITYQKNLRGNVTRITKNTEDIVTQSYDTNSRLVSRSFFNGIVGDFTYDGRGNMSGVSYTKENELITGVEYGFGKEQNVIWTKRLHDLNHSQQYLYDAGYRLIGYQEGLLDEDNEIQTPIINVSQMLDPMGNMLSITLNGSTETREVNALNQYTRVDQNTFLYDANGNLSDDTVFEYDYTMEGQLKRVTRKSDGQVVAQFLYDALLRRVVKQMPEDTTRFVYDNHHIIEEYSQDSLSVSHVYGGNLDDLVARSIDGQNQAYLTDGYGSVQSLTDDGGTFLEQYRYSPYGRPEILNPLMQVLPGSMINNAYLYAAKQWDAEIRTYDSRRRTYHPSLGRFLQPDPMGYSDSLNLYQYAFNNPLRWVDPFGENGLEAMLYDYLGQSEVKRKQSMDVLNAAHEKGLINEQQYAQSAELINCLADADQGARQASLQFAADTIQNLDALRAERLPETLKQVLDKETWEQLAKSLITSPCSAIQCLTELFRKIEEKDCEGVSNMLTRGTLEVLTIVGTGGVAGVTVKGGATLLTKVRKFKKGKKGKKGKKELDEKVKDRLRDIKYTKLTGISGKNINKYQQFTSDTGVTVYIRRNNPKAAGHEKKGTPPKPSKVDGEDVKGKTKDRPNATILHKDVEYSSDHDTYAFKKPDGTYMNAKESHAAIQTLKKDYGIDRLTDHDDHVNAFASVSPKKLKAIGPPGDVFSISPSGRVSITPHQQVKEIQMAVINRDAPGTVISWAQ